jgi:hypothetical protein
MAYVTRAIPTERFIWRLRADPVSHLSKAAMRATRGQSPRGSCTERPSGGYEVRQLNAGTTVVQGKSIASGDACP